MQLIMDNSKDMEVLQENKLREINCGFIVTLCTVICTIATVGGRILYYEGYSDGVKAREAAKTANAG